MRAIERATKHYKAGTPRVIKVEEWADENGDALSIYVFPLTVKDLDLFSHLASDNLNLTNMADILISRARDIEGKPLFSDDDKDAIVNDLDAMVVSRVVGEIQQDADTINDLASDSEVKKG